MDVIQVVTAGITAASAGILIAKAFGYSVSKTTAAIVEVAGLASAGIELLTDLEFKRCRGFLNYIRSGSA